MARFISSLALAGSIALSSACLVIVGVGPSAMLTPPPLILSPTHLIPTPHPGFSCPVLPPWSGTFVVRFGEGDEDFELDEIVVRFRGSPWPHRPVDGIRSNRSGRALRVGRSARSPEPRVRVRVSLRLRNGFVGDDLRVRPVRSVSGGIHETSGNVAVD